jgi:hypothetical protein
VILCLDDLLEAGAVTAQISDRILYRDRDFALAGVQGTGLFVPQEHGLTPQGTSTACWRGFVCTYRVANGVLTLEALHMGMPTEEVQAVQEGRGPPLFGQLPRYVEESYDGPVVYSGLRGPVPFSGGLLLAHGFIRELYVHMGFHPAWKYQEVHELIFESGRLVEERDCSEAMARVRERLAEQPLSPDASASKEEFSKWIEKTFRLDYT